MEDGWGEKETKERVSEVAEFSVNALRIWIGDRRLTGTWGACSRAHVCVCLLVWGGERLGWGRGGGALSGPLQMLEEFQYIQIRQDVLSYITDRACILED